ncbi:DUF6567 family protein [Natronoflexus pectinivorans]|uniref:Uncharacterized protein n=1 Tax=Natronoflexus pectinivorans TaxID=682526 RepID=A0A4V2RWF6_9BACT|nr:DUF6567 family protein [Natronoflexus pectinivorans]TCO08266.1 hypothetical protein EV194_10568 [Natronoflexus pectinivorans]
MKGYLILLITSLFILSSCGIHQGLTTNANLNSTEVVLAKNNYKVISSVEGQSEAMFIFGIGGLSKNAMIAEARNQMLSRAELVGNSRAVINETVEIKHSIFPIIRMYKVMVSGYVVEFID